MSIVHPPTQTRNPGLLLAQGTFRLEGSALQLCPALQLSDCPALLGPPTMPQVQKNSRMRVALCSQLLNVCKEHHGLASSQTNHLESVNKRRHFTLVGSDDGLHDLQRQAVLGKGLKAAIVLPNGFQERLQVFKLLRGSRGTSRRVGRCTCDAGQHGFVGLFLEVLQGQDVHRARYLLHNCARGLRASVVMEHDATLLHCPRNRRGLVSILPVFHGDLTRFSLRGLADHSAELLIISDPLLKDVVPEQDGAAACSGSLLHHLAGSALKGTLDVGQLALLHGHALLHKLKVLLLPLSGGEDVLALEAIRFGPWALSSFPILPSPVAGPNLGSTLGAPSLLLCRFPSAAGGLAVSSSHLREVDQSICPAQPEAMQLFVSHLQQ
mmetsp:Transcript_34353/g.97312  ORF Transcript_34353/g.97312 Transcript_34353/m.97312 type:complete len:381 (-) Transcript_34353:694-1836(-)